MTGYSDRCAYIQRRSATRIAPSTPDASRPATTSKGCPTTMSSNHESHSQPCPWCPPIAPGADAAIVPFSHASATATGASTGDGQDTVDIRKSRGVGITVGEWASDWKEELNVSASTENYYRGTFQRYILPYWASTPMTDITDRRVRMWARELHIGRGLAHGTAEGIVQLFARVVAAAVTSGYLPNNPIKPLPSRPRRSAARVDTARLEPREVVQIADQMAAIYGTCGATDRHRRLDRRPLGRTRRAPPLEPALARRRHRRCPDRPEGRHPGRVRDRSVARRAQSRAHHRPAALPGPPPPHAPDDPLPPARVHHPRAHAASARGVSQARSAPGSGRKSRSTRSSGSAVSDQAGPHVPRLSPEPPILGRRAGRASSAEWCGRADNRCRHANRAHGRLVTGRSTTDHAARPVGRRGREPAGTARGCVAASCELTARAAAGAGRQDAHGQRHGNVTLADDGVRARRRAAAWDVPLLRLR